jgi:hypothetical protein
MGGTVMTLSGAGALGVWHGVAEGQEQSVDEWYNREHHFERIGIPGFLRARRYVNLGQGPRYFSRYDVTDVSVLASAPYLSALNNPSPWSQRIFPHYRGTVRGAFRVSGRRGSAEGGIIATLRFASEPQELSPTGGVEKLLDSLAQAPGIVRAEAWLVDVPATTPNTREKELRVSAEAYPASVLVIEGSRADGLSAAIDRILPASLRGTATTDMLQLVFQAAA